MVEKSSQDSKDMAALRRLVIYTMQRHGYDVDQAFEFIRRRLKQPLISLPLPPPHEPQLSPVNAFKLYSETITRLEHYKKRVAERLDVLEAADFARWVQFSGIIRLLEDCRSGPPLKCDAREIASACANLIYDCAEMLRRKEIKPRDGTQLDQINEKLARLEALVTKAA